MNLRAVVVSLAVASIVIAPGCGRMARSVARMGSRSYGSRSSQPNPADIRISYTTPGPGSVKAMDKARAKWAEFCGKYEATELKGGAQIVAVLDAFNNAHWSEKPQVEDMVQPLGVAIGDALKARGDVNWALAENSVVCLVSTNGKVAVASLATARKWLTAKNHPFDALADEVQRAVRDTTGEPVLIGFDDGENQSDEAEIG